MGRSIAGIHLRGVPVANALALASDAFRAEGWTIAIEQSAGAAPLAVAASGGWTSIHLPRRWRWSAVERLIAENQAPGILLFTADSDSWGGALFVRGTIVYRFDTRKRAPGARTVRKQLRDVLGIEVPEAALKQALASRPTYAEEAMDAFARLLTLETALELPEGGTQTLWATPPQTPEQLRLASRLDVRADALVREPRPGFGIAVVELVRLLADRAGGGQLGPRSILVTRGNIERFGANDLAAIASRLDAGEIDSVDVDFEGLGFRCYRFGTHGRVLQIVAGELLAVDGTRQRDDRLGLLDPDAALLDHLFVQPGVTFGSIEVVPADAMRAGEELRALRAWPPVAHWLNFLDARLAAALGGASAIAARAPGWLVTALEGGGLIVRMDRGAHASRDDVGLASRATLSSVLASIV